MFATPLEQTLREMVGPTLEHMGYDLVLLRLRDGKRRTLELVTERTDGAGMTIDDCTEISNTVSAILDVEDPISGAYQLEVSSPGVERPLARAKDFERYAGMEAKLETVLPVEGRKRFRGLLKGIEGDEVVMEFEGKELRFALDGLKSARLVMTDELMRDMLKRSKQKEAGSVS